MVMGSCSPVSIVETSLAGGDLNAVGCGASGVGSLGGFPLPVWPTIPSQLGAGSSELRPRELVPRDCLGHLKTGVATKLVMLQLRE